MSSMTIAKGDTLRNWRFITIEKKDKYTDNT